MKSAIVPALYNSFPSHRDILHLDVVIPAHHFCQLCTLCQSIKKFQNAIFEKIMKSKPVVGTLYTTMCKLTTQILFLPKSPCEVIGEFFIQYVWWKKVVWIIRIYPFKTPPSQSNIKLQFSTSVNMLGQFKAPCSPYTKWEVKLPGGTQI